MKRGSVLGLIILMSLLIIIGFVAINSSGFIIEKYIRGASGYSPSSAIKETIETIKQTYTSFKKAVDMAMNPWKYMYEIDQAKVDPNLPKDISGLEFTSLSPITPANLFKCKNKECSDVFIPDSIVIATIRYSFLKDTKVSLKCNIQTTYDDHKCFIKECKLDSNTLSGIRGFISKKIVIHLEYNKSVPECHDCIYYSSSCLNKSVVFKDYGFRVTLSLKAQFEADSNTTYRALITTDKILELALYKKKSIYDILGLNPYDYDVAYYRGLIGYPRVDISRIGKSYNYPILLFGNEESYEALLFAVRPFNNIKEIKDLTIKIYKPNGINLKLLDGTCKDTYLNELKIDNKVLYSLNCLDKGNYYECKVYLDPKFIAWYRSNYDPTEFKFVIPICIKNDNLQGDYSELLVEAHLDYVYEKETSTELIYTPYYDVSIS